MLSINMRIFKSSLILIILFYSNVRSLPVVKEDSSSSSNSLADPSTSSPVNPSTDSPPSSSTSLENSGSSATSSKMDHYDQRQNGTENYRLHMDGLVLVIAPVEALLLAGASASEHNLTIEGLSSLNALNNALVAPKRNSVELTKSGVPPKSVHRGGLRLASLLAPFLRRVHHE